MRILQSVLNNNNKNIMKNEWIHKFFILLVNSKEELPNFFEK